MSSASILLACSTREQDAHTTFCKTGMLPVASHQLYDSFFLLFTPPTPALPDNL